MLEALHPSMREASDVVRTLPVEASFYFIHTWCIAWHKSSRPFSIFWGTKHVGNPCGLWPPGETVKTVKTVPRSSELERGWEGWHGLCCHWTL
jgi:hypothetical protein